MCSAEFALCVCPYHHIIIKHHRRHHQASTLCTIVCCWLSRCLFKFYEWNKQSKRRKANWMVEGMWEWFVHVFFFFFTSHRRRLLFFSSSASYFLTVCSLHSSSPVVSLSSIVTFALGIRNFHTLRASIIISLPPSLPPARRHCKCFFDVCSLKLLRHTAECEWRELAQLCRWPELSIDWLYVKITTFHIPFVRYYVPYSTSNSLHPSSWCACAFFLYHTIDHRNTTHDRDPTTST